MEKLKLREEKWLMARREFIAEAGHELLCLTCSTPPHCCSPGAIVTLLDHRAIWRPQSNMAARINGGWHAWLGQGLPGTNH